jgi:hypothetical protein
MLSIIRRGVLYLARGYVANELGERDGIAGTLKTLGHYGTLGIKDVIVTFSYPDCLSSSALSRASFGVLKLSA